MILARDQVTLIDQTDIQETIYYYKKQASTLPAPSKPASYPASGWDTVEPQYSAGETSTLYTTVCTLYYDGTFNYADVSVSASFEAAKAAYNKASAVETALEDYVNPIASHEFTDVTIPANSDPGGWLYFASVKPTAYLTPWRIRYRLHATINGYAEGNQTSEVTIDGMKSTYAAYRTYNAITNTSYRPIYAHVLYTLTQAGVNAGYGHLLGIRFQSVNVPTAKRNVTIEILEMENCTVEFTDPMIPYANAPGTGSTNYATRTSYDGTTQGYTESGDRNETNHVLNNARLKIGRAGAWAYGLVMRDGEGLYQNICTAADGTATSSNRTAATTKKANTDGFEVGGKIYYVGGSSYNTGSYLGSPYASYGVFDSRYSINSTLTANFLDTTKPIYLVGEVDADDGLYYLDEVWWTQDPTEQGKVYVLIGMVYDSTTSYCRFNLYEDNSWLVYNGTRLIEYTKKLADNAQATANNALTMANGKNKIFFQDAAPTGTLTAGDLWFDTDGGNAIYEYKITGDTGQWQLRQLGQGSLVENSVTANEINVNMLSAISVNIGTVTAGVLKSSDYAYTSGNYSTAGMLIDLNNKIIRTPKFAVDADGNVYASGGTIGGWTISSTQLYKDTVDVATDREYQYRAGLQATNVVNAFSKAFEISGRQYNDGVYGDWEDIFYITYGGNIVANQGVIGGWTLEKNYLHNAFEVETTEDNVTTRTEYSAYLRAGINQDPASRAYTINKRTKVGSGSWSAMEYLFEVRYDGTLIAKNANVTGTIHADSGSGNIGGWDISTQSLIKTGNAITETVDGVSVSATYLAEMAWPTGVNDTNYKRIFSVRREESGTWTSPFVVYYDGRLVSKKAEITGEVTAKSGKIGAFSLISTGSAITPGALYSGQHSSLTSNVDGIYIGSNGISAGANGKVQISDAGVLKVTNAAYIALLATGSKTTGADGKTGVFVTDTGNIHLTHGSAGSNLFFYYDNSTSITSQIYEAAAGRIAINNNLYVPTNIYSNNAIAFRNANLTKGENPSASTGYKGIRWTEGDNYEVGEAYRLADIRHLTTAGGINILQMRAFANVAGSTYSSALNIASSVDASSFGYLYTYGVAYMEITLSSATQEVSYRLTNSQAKGVMTVNSAGNFGLYSSTHSAYLIYIDKTNKKVKLPLAYSVTTTSAANVNVASDGTLARYSSSSRRYKHDIKPLTDYRKVLDIPVVSFVYNDDYISADDQRYRKDIPGLIAEDVAEHYPIAADVVNGKVEDWNSRYIIPPMLGVIKEHEDRITALERENRSLRAEIEKLKGAA